jgi:hypothetical protein
VYGSVNRPQWDVGDVATGVEDGGSGLYNRVPANGVFDWYVGALPNNPGGTSNNWTEELSTSGHTFNEPVTVNGNLTITGTCTGCGGGGAGTVNSGTASQVAVYPGNGAAVSGDSALSDSGTTLNYAGSGGISAAAGTFSGNVTVNGQLMVAGPWMVSSPIPGSAMGAAASGTSALGISNDGNFYISANSGTPQKVVTTATSSFFSNLFQEDGNDLGEFNGTAAQGLHVYGTYTNSSNYERTGLGWDSTDGYFVLKNENAGTGAQRGIGFWIGSGVRWAIDTVSTLKPGSNNSFNIGTTTFAPQTIYAATSFDTLTQGRQNFELCNDGSTGTSLNFLATYNGATPACAVKATAGPTDGVIGVVSNGSGTSGNAVITYRGYVPCSFDGSTTTGDFVVASTTNAGDCHDAGTTRPAGVQVIGRVESTNSGVGTYGVRAALEAPSDSGVTPGPYSIPWFTTNTTGTAITFSSTASKAELWGAVLTFPLTTTQVTYFVSTADNSANTYDIGVLNSSGTVVAHIGSTAGTTFAPITGWKTLSWTGSATLQPGRYYLAITSSCTSACAQLYGGTTAGFTFVGGPSGTSESVSAGGTLNNGITIPADNPTEATILSWEVH